jgi:hypothetical protein
VIRDLRYVDDRVYLLNDHVRREMQWWGEVSIHPTEHWPFANRLRLLRGFLVNPLARLVLQYIYVGRNVLRLHSELLEYIEENTMPDLIELD